MQVISASTYVILMSLFTLIIYVLIRIYRYRFSENKIFYTFNIIMFFLIAIDALVKDTGSSILLPFIIENPTDVIVPSIILFIIHFYMAVFKLKRWDIEINEKKGSGDNDNQKFHKYIKIPGTGYLIKNKTSG